MSRRARAWALERFGLALVSDRGDRENTYVSRFIVPLGFVLALVISILIG